MARRVEYEEEGGEGRVYCSKRVTGLGCDLPPRAYPLPPCQASPGSAMEINTCTYALTFVAKPRPADPLPLGSGEHSRGQAPPSRIGSSRQCLVPLPTRR